MFDKDFLNGVDPEERIKFYLGDCFNKHFIDQENNFSLFFKDSNTYYSCNSSLKREKNKKNYKYFYFFPLKTLIDEYKFFDKKIYVMPGDISEPCLDFFAFSKTRRIDDFYHKYVLLKCFEKKRHWRLVSKCDNINFKNKLNIAIWRGATSGKLTIENNGGFLRNRLNNRFLLVDKYSTGFSNIDVGFSKIVCRNNPVLDQICSSYNPMVKEHLDIKSLRKYKYIISIEGNDKDSGLNWKLASNSVVLMAKPIINSWLMEEKLLPNVHYVQLADDLSDLEEKIYWCDSNQDACEYIIHNANEYMKQFSNRCAEAFIEFKVINEFIKKTNYKLYYS